MEKKCSKCGECKPMESGFYKKGDRWRSVCKVCDGAEFRARNQKKAMAVRPWTEEEDAIIADHYPDGRALACIPFLSGRSVSVIQHRARQLGVTAVRCESSLPWPIPQQDSAPLHLLFQRTPVPTFYSGNPVARIAA